MPNKTIIAAVIGIGCLIGAVNVNAEITGAVTLKDVRRGPN